MYLVILSIYDIRSRKVPVIWLVMGSLAAAVQIIWSVCPVCTVSESSGNLQALWYSVWLLYGRGLLLGCFPGLIMLCACFITGRVGSADGWVLLILGSVVSCGQIFAAFGCSMILIALAAGGLLVLKKVKKDDRLPYLPFLTAAVVLVQI